MKTENELVQENMGLVVSLAKSFNPPNQDTLEDYIQAGSLGLLKSIRKYDPKRAKLSTYAWPQIRWEILHWIKCNSKQQLVYSDNLDVAYEEDPDAIKNFLPFSLTEEERTAVEMKLEGHSLKEIGKKMNVNAYTLLGKVKEKIRLAHET